MTWVAFCTQLVGFVILMNVKLVRTHNSKESKELTDDCAIAVVCKHTGVNVCGVHSASDCKQFIDYCDMHEYNCDHHKAYILQSASSCKPSCLSQDTAKKTATTIKEKAMGLHGTLPPISRDNVRMATGSGCDHPEFYTPRDRD